MKAIYHHSIFTNDENQVKRNWKTFSLVNPKAARSALEFPR
jgi:hypothetical protein